MEERKEMVGAGEGGKTYWDLVPKDIWRYCVEPLVERRSAIRVTAHGATLEWVRISELVETYMIYDGYHFQTRKAEPFVRNRLHNGFPPHLVIHTEPIYILKHPHPEIIEDILTLEGLEELIQNERGTKRFFPPQRN